MKPENIEGHLSFARVGRIPCTTIRIVPASSCIFISHQEISFVQVTVIFDAINPHLRVRHIFV